MQLRVKISRTSVLLVATPLAMRNKNDHYPMNSPKIHNQIFANSMHPRMASIFPPISAIG